MQVHVPRIGGILLAAGRSTRFGSTKQLASWHGEPLVRHVARQVLASVLSDLVVVVGHDADEVTAAVAGLPVRVVVNAAYAEGQNTSIRTGLAELGAATEAVMFITCDQPLLRPDIIDRLVASFAAGGVAAVVPTVAGQRRSPVVFGRTLFGDLRALEGDTGGRGVLLRHGTLVRELPFDAAEPFEDVDTPAAWQALVTSTHRG